jgi:hypothetical protein
LFDGKNIPAEIDMTDIESGFNSYYK